MIGNTLSHYRIDSELGRGGMGIVYEAFDTRLDRTVALKVLPAAALASDEDRARFYREAKAAAQLNHPHICQVYEVDEAVPSGSKDDDRRPFIAMEFIDGVTLASRIGRAPLPLTEAVGIAIQIAEALKAAHAKNIVHRDIKSANVMLTTDGSAKVLDFGLAQTVASTKLTRLGSTVGTVAYMSPEQARGEPVDRRSDIYSLGTVLYEMVAGRLPFPGEYEQAVLYGILNEDPEPLTALRTGVPMALEALVVKCLAKDPAYRYPSADGLIVDLKRVDTTSVVISARLTTRMADAAAAPTPARHSRAAWMLPTLAGAVMLAVGMLARPLIFGDSSEPQLVMRTQLVLPDAISPLEAAIAPDDRTLYYVASDSDGSNRDLVAYSFENGSTRRIEGTRGAGRPIVSADGRWLAYLNQQTKQWWKMATSGGEPTEVPGAASVTVYFSGAFTADGDLLFSPDYESINRVANDGSQWTAAVIDPVVMAPYLGAISASPSGSFFTWSDWDGRGVPISSWILRTGENQAEVLLEDALVHRITPSGHALFIRGHHREAQQTLAVPIDLRSGAIMGDEVPLGRRSIPAVVSPSGLLVFEELPGAETFDRRRDLYRILPSGAEEFVLTLPGVFSEDFELSGDGSTLAVSGGLDVESHSDIFVASLLSGASTRLTQGGNYQRPTWGPGDEHLYFEHRRPDQAGFRILRRRSDGSGSNEEVFPGEVDVLSPDLTPDGRFLVYRDTERESIRTYDTAADSAYSLAQNGFDPMISPDGQSVVYVQGEDCGSVQVTAADGSSAPIEIAAFGCSPRWNSEGDHIYFENKGSIHRLRVRTEPVFEKLGQVETPFSGPTTEAGYYGRVYFDVGTDGTLYVALRRHRLEKGPIWVVTNWFEELNRLAPRSD